jgi:hypothetical protein
MRLKPTHRRKPSTIQIEARYKKLSPKRCKGPVVLLPWAFTRRIEAQAGRFTYSVHRHPEIPLDKCPEPKPWVGPIHNLVVPHDLKATIREELDRCLIHRGTLFPDLDGCAKYLADGGLWGRLCP